MRPSMLRHSRISAFRRRRGIACASDPLRGTAARPRGELLGPAGFVKLGVDGTSRLGRNAGDALELLLRGGEKTLRGAEVLQESAAAGRSHTFEIVEDRGERPRV